MAVQPSSVLVDTMVMGGTVDPRIASALDWCAARGLRSLLLAAPFGLDAPTLRLLASRPEVAGRILWPGNPGSAADSRDGEFQPCNFSWRLPAPCPPHIVFIECRGALTARMIAIALRRRVRTVIYTELGDWCQRSLLHLAAAKFLGKASAACDIAGGRLCHWLLHARYQQAFRRLLAAAPLRFPALPDTQSGAPRQGIVLACPTLVAGGAERQVLNTAVGLRAAGNGPVTVLVARLHSPPGNAFFLPRLLAAGVGVREVASTSGGLARWQQAQGMAASPDGRAALALLRQIPQPLMQDVLDLCVELAALNPAVVHCWLDYSNVRAGLAAACVGVPRIVLSGRNVGPQHFPYILEPFMRSAYRALLNHPALVLTNNSSGGARDYAAWLGIAAARIGIIYNGANVDALHRPSVADIRAFRARHDIAADALVVGGMFRFSAEKQPLLWLEVAARVLRERPATRLAVFGEGPLRPAMQRFIDTRQLTDQIKLLVPTSDNVLALAAFDLLLLTSAWEGTPNVAIEAQAVGTAVVATGGGGAAEALSPGVTGLYVAQPKPGLLAAAVLELLADSKRRLRMAAAGPSFVNNRFAMSKMLRNTMEAYVLRP